MQEQLLANNSHVHVLDLEPVFHRHPTTRRCLQNLGLQTGATPAAELAALLQSCGQKAGTDAGVKAPVLA